jgi:superfamily II DNA helicase RecQ
LAIIIEDAKMQTKFFWIPAFDSLEAEGELNTFLASHRAVKIDRNFLAAEASPGWCICIDWVSPSEEPAKNFAAKERKIDYREVLDDESFRIFAILRTWRKERAAMQGVPVYTVATNEQLAHIARDRIHTKGELEKVEGFGGSRMGKYADELVALCNESFKAIGGDS